MVRVPRLLPVGALALLASGLVTGLAGAVVGSVGLLSATVAQAQEAQPDGFTDAAPAKRGRRSRRERTPRAEKKAATPPGMQQATPVAIFGDWNVFVNGDGRAKLCYAIAQPQTRSPKTLKRDTAYLFVSVRKGENVQNEVAVMLGFPSKPAASQGRNGQERPGAPARSGRPGAKPGRRPAGAGAARPGRPAGGNRRRAR